MTTGPHTESSTAASALTRASRSGSYAAPTAITRLVAVHFCPAYPAMAAAMCAAANPRSASGSTNAAFRPPSSACTGTPRPVAARTTARPTPVEPVKETTSAVSTSAAPSSAPPGSTVNTSSGSPAARASSASRSAHAVASGAGLRTAVLPTARAGAAFQLGIASGKFQGAISPATPYGRRRVSSSPGPAAVSCTAPDGVYGACA